MKILTDFLKMVETCVDPRRQNKSHWDSGIITVEPG